MQASNKRSISPLPGKMVAIAMKKRGWTQQDLAMILGKPQPFISQIITGKRSVTPETAHALAQAFGDTPQYWMEIEARFRVSLVAPQDQTVRNRAHLFEIAPVKDMEKRGWIKKTKSPKDLEGELRSFFETDNLDSIPSLCVHSKKTQRTDPLTAEQRAWCFRAKSLASPIKAKKFSLAGFDKGIDQLRVLAAWPDHARKVTSVLADMGIRMVVIEPLARTRIDGASFWLNQYSPVIAISIRYDRIDSFWHTLGHELSHVRNNDGLKLDMDLVGENRSSPAELNSTERRADIEAVNFVIDQQELEDFIVRVGPLYSRARINQFANRIRVHPGIIVGQLQYRGELSYSQLRNTLVKVREAVTSEAVTDGWGHFVSG